MIGKELLSAAQSCLSPDQYENFEAMGINDSKVYERLAHAHRTQLLQKPLTDKEIYKCLVTICREGSAPSYDEYLHDVDNVNCFTQFTRAVEAAHGIGEKK